MLFAKSLLHSDDVEAEPVFPCDFMTLREVVDLLVLVQAFVQVALAAGGAPQNVPLMGLGGRESCSLKDRADQFVVEAEHLIEQLTVFYVVALLISVELHRVSHQLLFGNIFEDKEV